GVPQVGGRGGWAGPGGVVLGGDREKGVRARGDVGRSITGGKGPRTPPGRRSGPPQPRRNPSTPSPPIHTYQSSGFDRPGNVRAAALFSEYVQIATAMLRHRNNVLSTRPSQPDHDRPCHA